MINIEIEVQFGEILASIQCTSTVTVLYCRVILITGMPAQRDVEGDVVLLKKRCGSSGRLLVGMRVCYTLTT